MASLVLGTVGTSLLGPLGGFIGSTVGSIIDNLLFAPAAPDISPPLLDDTETSVAAPGSPIPLVYGTERVPGIVIHASDFIVEPVYVGEEFGLPPTLVGYNYFITVDILLCEGPILGIGRIWADGMLIRGLVDDWVTDTKSDQFKAGGLPYSDYYRDIGLLWTGTSVLSARATRIFKPEEIHYDLDLTDLPIDPDARDTAFWAIPRNRTDGALKFWENSGNRLLRMGYHIDTEPWFMAYQNQLDYSDFDNPATFIPSPWKPTVAYTGRGAYDHRFNNGWFNEDREWLPYQELETTELDYSFSENVEEATRGNITGIGGELGASITHFFADGSRIPEEGTWPRAWSKLYIDGQSSAPADPASVPPQHLETENTYISMRTKSHPNLPIDYGDAPPLNQTPNRVAAWAGPDNLSGQSLGSNQSPLIAKTIGFLLRDTNSIGNTPSFIQYGGVAVTLLTNDLSFWDGGFFDLVSSVEQAWSLVDSGSAYLTIQFTANHINKYSPTSYNGGTKLHGISLLVMLSESENPQPQDFYVLMEDSFDMSSGPNDTRHVQKMRTFNLPPRTRSIYVSMFAGYDSRPVELHQLNASHSSTLNAEVGCYITSGSPLVQRKRTWDDYYNLFAALNDFNPWSVFHMIPKMDDIRLYRGYPNQQADAGMALVAGEPVPAYRNRAHVVLEKLALADYGNRLPNLSFEVVRYENDTINTVVVDLMQRAGLDESYYDLSEFPVVPGEWNSTEVDLETFVPGYVIARRTSMRKALDVLLNAFRIDSAEINYKLIFRPKVRTYTHTIDYNDLNARDSGNDPQPPLTINRRDLIDLPKEIETFFRDVEREYQDNTARWIRTQTGSDQKSTIQLPVVMYPHVAKAWARSKLQELWVSGLTFSFELPPEYIFVSPSDYILIETDTVIGQVDGLDVFAEFIVRVVNIRRGDNGTLSVEGVLTTHSLYPVDDYLLIPTENKYINRGLRKTFPNTITYLFETPVVRENEQNDYGWFFAACDDNDPTWVGANLFRRDPSAEFGDGFFEIREAYRFARQMPRPAAIGKVFDGQLLNDYGQVAEGESVILVELYSAIATLTSVGLDGALNMQNKAKIGDEIVCFANAQQVGARTYQLSGFVRGLHQTANAVHGLGEDFVLIDEVENFYSVPAVRDAGIVYWDIDRNLILNNLWVTMGWVEDAFRLYRYSGPSRGLPPTQSREISFTSGNIRGKRFTPAMVTGQRELNNEITINWVRHERTFFRWVDFLDLEELPLSHSYLLEFYVNDELKYTTSSFRESYTLTIVEQNSADILVTDTVLVRVKERKTDDNRLDSDWVELIV